MAHGAGEEAPALKLLRLQSGEAACLSLVSVGVPWKVAFEENVRKPLI